MTFLENLSDDTFLLVYQYLNSIDILYAFTDLNRRIEQTLLEHKQHIDLRYVSLKQYYFFFKNIPKLKDHIVSLVVDDEWTDGIPLWCAVDLPQLQKLTIVSFYKLNLDAFLNKVSCPMLENLHVGREFIPSPIDDRHKPSTFLSQIQNLKRLHWNESFIGFPYGACDAKNSIEHLTVSVDDASSLLVILKSSPCLRYFKGFAMDDDGSTDTMNLYLPHLREFHLSITDKGNWYWSTIDKLMRCLPSTLERFSFKGAVGFESKWLDGNTWARSAPCFIQSFQLVLKAYNSTCFPLRMDPEQIKESWSTPFWIHKKHCYMQCFDVESFRPHLLLCTYDCSDFDSIDDSMSKAKLVFNLKPTDSVNFVHKSVGQLDLNSLNRDAHTWINQRRRALPTDEELFFQDGRISLTTDIALAYIDSFRHLQCLTLSSSSSVSDDLIQYVSSFSCLTSLTILDLAAAILILNCDRLFNRIKIVRINIKDLDIDHIELDRLLQVFPHLYAFHIGFILHTQLERLINEKLSAIMPTSLKVAFRPNNFSKIKNENDKIGDESDVEDKYESEQEAIKNELARNVTGWFRDCTFFGDPPNKHKWIASHYAHEHQFGTSDECITVWH